MPFKESIKIFYVIKPSKSLQTPVLEDKINFIVLNPLMPIDILRTEWTNWNEPDIIKYKSASGGVYIVQDENLLIAINEFMQANDIKSKLPFLHVKGKEKWECYSAPEDIHILEYLWAYHYNYNIYTGNGELVQEENKEEELIFV
jgi:hypothetical protein